MKKTFLVTIGIILSLSAGTESFAQTAIRLNEEEDGKYTMEATVNGIRVRTYYVPDAWYSSMSATTYLFLTENGYIQNADIKGMTTVKTPSGKTEKAGAFVIKSLRIGNLIVRNLPAFVIYSQNVPLLVGNSAFDCFGEVRQEGTLLIVEDGIDHGTRDVADMGKVHGARDAADTDDFSAGSIFITVDLDKPEDRLLVKAQTLTEQKRYAEAEKAWEELSQTGTLSMLSCYEYLMILNILERDDKLISLSGTWLEDHAGKTPMMDYWVYAALGNAYSRKSEADKAIESYTKAVGTYCEMFQTSEENLKYSNFQDEALGAVLYNLGRQYAVKKNLKQARYYCSIGAACGSKAAKEYCDKHGIKY